METFTAQVMPIAKLDEWRDFVESAANGERADAHREMLRRIGVSCEHIFRQTTPAGDLMILVWEGIDPEQVGQAMGEMIQHPQTDHERYLATHVIPTIHGIDLGAGPPPHIERVATIKA